MSELAIAPDKISQSHDIQAIFENLKANQFNVGRTTVRARIAKLKRFHATMLHFQEEINEAMWADFRKSPTEVAISEIGVVNTEIRHAIRNLRTWLTPKRVGMPLMMIGTRSEIRYEPKGVCLIIAPWNFPFCLSLAPVALAVAAGNVVVLKPSEMAPHSSAVMKKIIEAVFPANEVAVVEGAVEESTQLLALPFNHIFFTGSPQVGKIVMRAAAEHLASVTLELGGKSPVIVDETANLNLAAAQISWINAMNAGQICIAPDYVLVHENVKEALLLKLKEKSEKFYGNTPEARATTPDYARLSTDRHFSRVKALLDDALAQGAQLVFGGNTNAAERYIEPTLLDHVPEHAKIWKEEVFGPVLPIRTFKHIEEVIEYVNKDERPLAMYIFSARKRFIEQIFAETRSGGVAANECAIQFYHNDLPFGGSNNSGTGKGHGEFGFMEFINQRGITFQNRIFPHTLLFMPPYGGKLARFLLKGVARWF